MSRLNEIVRNGAAYALESVRPGSRERRVVARRHFRRRLALEFLCRFRKEITFRRNGFVWTGPSSCTITRAIFIDGQHQDIYIDSLAKWIISDRPVIVNVGANIGDTALPLSRAGKRVLAIEPAPETFDRLKQNVKANHLDGVITCFQVAISATAGTVDLVIADQPGNNEVLGEQGKVGFDGGDRRREVVRVPTIPLDELLKSVSIGLDQVALVWSDTQGFESQVVESGSALWSSGTPLWVEVWPRGLDCHGGVDRFVELCKQHFTHIATPTGLDLTLKPVAEIDSLVKKLRGYDGTSDILLIQTGHPDV